MTWKTVKVIPTFIKGKKYNLGTIRKITSMCITEKKWKS